jgi:hypothetical protein
MLWHGSGPGEDGCFLHNARYEVNDTALPIGTSFLARLAGGSSTCPHGAAGDPSPNQPPFTFLLESFRESYDTCPRPGWVARLLPAPRARSSRRPELPTVPSISA